MKHKTSLNEFLKIEDDIQYKVDSIIINAFRETFDVACVLISHTKQFKILFDKIPLEYKNIVGFEEKFINFINEFNEYLKKYSYEEMKKVNLAYAFVVLTEPRIKEIKYKNV